MKYYSTRNKQIKVSGMEAILQGIAQDGGLFVPEYIPKLTNLKALEGFSYRRLAAQILGLYFEEYSEEQLKKYVEGAYTEKFHWKEPVRIRENGGIHFLELFHGPTLAFKDMALTVLPHLLLGALERKGIEEEVVILTATSGDTGKAALEGFRDGPGVQVIVFYPEEGVSEMQNLQMVTQKGKNTHVVALKGNFDDAQNGVKKIFGDEKYGEMLREKGYRLSSANSINIGRLIPQIVYYIYGYLKMVENGNITQGEEINVAVPTGNFGNILAAYYAREMGLPVAKLICASNDNKVLADFFETGTYDRKRKLHLTSSPSMDILISSNLERFLYHVSGEEDTLISDLMKSLSETGSFQWSGVKEMDIYGGFAEEDAVSESIRTMYSENGYVMDPHTAVAYSVYEKYRKETGDEKSVLLASTASPFKFPEKVLSSLGRALPKDLFERIESLAECMKEDVPEEIEKLWSLPRLHQTVAEEDEMRDVILGFLEGGKGHDSN